MAVRAPHRVGSCCTVLIRTVDRVLPTCIEHQVAGLGSTPVIQPSNRRMTGEERRRRLGHIYRAALFSLNQTFTLSQEQTLTEHSPNTGPGIPVADLSRATEQGKSERFPRGHDAMSAQQGP